MDEIELLTRLKALEQRNADQDRKNAVQSFINNYGASFSGNPALGDVFYTELQNRLGAGAIKEINAEATQQLVDGLIDDIDTLKKYLKHSMRAAEDMLDDVESRTQDLEKSGTKENNPVDTDTMPTEDELDFNSIPAEMPPEDFMAEAAAPAPEATPEVPPEVPPEVSPEVASVPPEATPVLAAPEAAPVSPEAGTTPMVSDARMKNIKAGRNAISKFINKSKAPEGMKLSTNIISACGGN